jgi:mitochondrial import inner membrane translocase subunit TIM8
MAGDDELSPQLQQFVEQEQQKMLIHQYISQVASECFDKCIATPNRSLSSRETECVRNCALRFKDTQAFVTQYLVRRGEQASSGSSF